MKLTENQIENLYKFTRKHYVEYYDVQSELVDHLANDIEQILKENPKLTFEQARDKSFKKFGIFGFMDVVQAKEWQMTKKYIKLVFQYAKAWFKLPKILLTAFVFYVFYQVQNYEFGHSIYYIFFFGLMISQLIYMIFSGRKLKQKQQKTGKKWLFENVIFVNGMGNILVFVLWFYDFPFNSVEEFLAMGEFRRILSAFLMTFLLIVGYIILIVIPKKAQQLLQETYSYYQLN